MTPAASPVGLISNPNSGHNREQFRKLRHLIDHSSSIHHLVTRSAADIDAALETLAQRRIELLAINGGDGTVAAILGRLLETNYFPKPPIVALLPGGTANMTAGDIGVSGSLTSALTRFCQWCDGERNIRGQLRQRPLLRARIDDQNEAHYGMFLGSGAIIHGTEYAHEQVHSRGLRNDFSVALITLRTVWGVLRDDPTFNHHVELELQLDNNERKKFDTLILAISTLERLAFGMRPFWSDEPGPIKLTLMEQGCSKFARTFYSIARGKPNDNAVPISGYHSHNADQLYLSMRGKVNIDGEVMSVAQSLHLAATQPLEFLRL